jgi:hypothetical protein
MAGFVVGGMVKTTKRGTRKITEMKRPVVQAKINAQSRWICWERLVSGRSRKIQELSTAADSDIPQFMV